MKQILLSMALLMGGISAISATDNPVTKVIDAGKSIIYWKGQKVTGTHTGTINVKAGELQFDKGMLAGGKIVVDMTSIKNTDMSGQGAERLEGHLKSPDFFAVEEFQEAVLEITEVISRGKEGEYRVTADLTIKGITKPTKFNVFTEDGVMKAALTVDRSEYNVRYGSGSFFDNLGDKTIYDEFHMDTEIYLVSEQ